MHIYRSMNTIKAITFDLDDTLYDNSDIVEKSEEEIVKYLQRYEGLQHLTVSGLHLEKKAVLAANPEIYHDVEIGRASCRERV